MQQSEPSKVAIFGNADYAWNIWETKEEADKSWNDAFSFVDHNSAIMNDASDALRELSKHMINQAMDTRVTPLQESVDRSFHLSIDGEECQVCSRVTLYCNKVKLFKSMCLCVRKDVWVIFEQHLLRWSSNAWGELKVKSEEKMLDFLVDTPLLSVLALA